MLTPLLVHGTFDDVGELLKCQQFWHFVNVVLIKHPFINERVSITRGRNCKVDKLIFDSPVFLLP